MASTLLPAFAGHGTARARRGIAALLVWLVLAVTFFPTSSHATDPFRVDGILVDVSAQDAVTARSDAIREAERKGLAVLFDRLVAPADRNRVAVPGDAEIARLVRSFEIADEKVAPARYAAIINVTYQESAILDYLDIAAVGYVSQPSEPVVVVPVERRNGELFLWDDTSAWKAAWSRLARGGSLLDIILPLGDLDDLSTLDATAVETASASAAQSLADRYGASDLLAVIATMPLDAQPGIGPDFVEIVGLAGDAAATAPRRVETDAERPVGNPFDQAAIATLAILEGRYTASRALSADRMTTLQIEAPLESLRQWVSLSDQLSSLAGVRRVDLLSFSRTEAMLDLVYAGDVADLVADLGVRGYRLQSESGRWRLRQ